MKVNKQAAFAAVATVFIGVFIMWIMYYAGWKSGMKQAESKLTEEYQKGLDVGWRKGYAEALKENTEEHKWQK